jgi:hypothetical protein
MWGWDTHRQVATPHPTGETLTHPPYTMGGQDGETQVSVRFDRT